MTGLHRNLIFFDKNSEMRTWISGDQMGTLPYYQIRTMIRSGRIIPASQMKFYYKRRCRNGNK